MENKRIWAILVVALFGGNLTGLTGIIGNHNTKTGHEDLQRQLNDIKANDAECRSNVSEIFERCAATQGTIQKHDAQIQELYRRIK